jgi:hypothetical protein
MSNKLIWAVWLSLMILWNFGVPNALPYEDVFVAVVLSVIVKKLEGVII